MKRLKLLLFNLGLWSSLQAYAAQSLFIEVNNMTTVSPLSMLLFFEDTKLDSKFKSSSQKNKFSGRLIVADGSTLYFILGDEYLHNSCRFAITAQDSHPSIYIRSKGKAKCWTTTQGDPKHIMLNIAEF